MVGSTVRIVQMPVLWMVMTALAFTIFGCSEDVTVTTPGQTVEVGGVEFAVGDYEIRYLEIYEDDETYEYPRPVLAIPVTIKNVGEGNFIYSPSHNSQQMSEASTPLLYLHPGGEKALPPESKSTINGVFLEKGSPEGQVKNSTTLASGDSIQDVFLFEVPDAENDLVLSIPPSMHRARLPVLTTFTFVPREAVGPRMYSPGDAIDFEGVVFTLKSAATEFVKLNDPSRGEGFSSDALYKLSFSIENTTDAAVTYDPGHNAVGARGAALYGKSASYKRVRFSASTKVEGRQSSSVKVEPNATVEDFVLFEPPREEEDSVVLEYPAARFDRAGLARVVIGYTYEEPDTPEELKKKEPSD